ncbi:Eco57I restriction-modification methylase domain-containing protein [Porphyromonas asaccharolytica]|uniref:Eco57I restriction-modification methylase domain-containing protein n=1 Tax=Porphyromonas asaccharolytica TaxID=28123 RepID=UPI0011118CDE
MTRSCTTASSDFTTYDILDKEKKDRIMQQLIDMNFEIVIGNPPYQESDGGREQVKPTWYE